MDSVKVTHVSIEGVIAAGKTTLQNLLIDEWRARHAECLAVKIVEPVDLWREMGLLQAFYEDPARWTYTFQSFSFQSRVTTYMTALNEALGKLRSKSEGVGRRLLVLSDRSILLDFHAFGTMLKDSGMMTRLEWNVYSSWWHSFARFLDPSVFPVGHIHLSTSTETALARMAIRSRGEEATGVSEAYMRDLRAYHERYFADPALCTVPVLEVDGVPEFVGDEGRQNAIVADCMSFLEKLTLG